MRISLACIPIALALAGCGEPAEPPEPVASVEVSPTSDTLMVGEPRQFSAQVTDAAGQGLDGRTIFWISSDPDIVSVSTNGVVTGLSNGAVTITATVEGVQGTAAVIVRQPFQALMVTAGWSFVGGHTCALDFSGAAFCWAYNWAGVLGTGFSFGTDSVPAPVAGGLTFSILSASDHTCGMTESGQVYCWGPNQDGQVGDGTTVDRLVPTKVVGSLSFSRVSAGEGDTCGLVGGSTYCWGASYWRDPQPTALGFDFTEITVGSRHRCGLTTLNIANCWGTNWQGQLGDGTTNNRSHPDSVVGGLRFQSIHAGDRHTCGLSTAGVAYCWGANEAGQLGDNSTTDRLIPMPVAGGSMFSTLAAGSSHNCGVTPTGDAYCWGRNGGGNLGDGTTIDRLAPVLVAGGHVFTSVAAGGEHSCGIEVGGTLHCWGRNDFAQLGDGTTVDRLVPTAVLLD